jgi:phage tail-like protein
MAEFPVNPKRFDPYKNFKFRLKWDGVYVAGVSKVSALKRTTEVIEFRDGGDRFGRAQIARPHRI